MSNVLNASGRKLFSDIEDKNISTEVISYQNDIFGKQLEEVVEKIYNKLLEKDKESIFSRNKKIISIKPETDILVKLIYDRLGIKVKILEDFTVAGVIPAVINDSHIFFYDFLKNGSLSKDTDFKDLMKKVQKQSIIKGTIDLEKSKVGGVFSELENKLYIHFPILLIDLKLTVKEVVAIILHELGHIFYYFEYSNRLEESNQILSNGLRELLNDKDKKDLVYIFKEIQTINDKISESDIDDIVNGKNIVPNLKLIKIISGSVSSQLLNRKYNETSFEQLADNFCNRFGYGRALVSSMEKTDITGNFFVYFKLLISTLYYTMLPILLVLSIITPMAVVIKIFNIYVYSLITYYSYYFLGENNKDYTYDNIRRRYKRIRNDMVEILKNTKNISKEEITGIINNIDELDKIISNTNVPENINKKLIDFFISTNRSAKASINEQQLMEDLVSNDLFIKSEKLKTI